MLSSLIELIYWVKRVKIKLKHGNEVIFSTKTLDWGLWRWKHWICTVRLISVKWWAINKARILDLFGLYKTDLGGSEEQKLMPVILFYDSFMRLYWSQWWNQFVAAAHVMGFNMNPCFLFQIWTSFFSPRPTAFKTKSRVNFLNVSEVSRTFPTIIWFTFCSMSFNPIILLNVFKLLIILLTR